MNLPPPLRRASGPAGGRYVPLWIRIALAVLAPVTLILAMERIVSAFRQQSEFLEDYVRVQQQAESSIVRFVRAVGRGYQMLELSLEPKLLASFGPFVDEYYRAGKDLASMNLVRARHELGAVYDLYVIDERGVVVKSTNPRAVGLDFRRWPVFFERLERIRRGNRFVMDHLALDYTNNSLRAWAFSPSPDHRYVFEVGMTTAAVRELVADLDIMTLARDLAETNPILESVRIFDTNAHLFDDADFRPDERTRLAVARTVSSGSWEAESGDSLVKYLLVDLRDDAPSDPSRVVELVYRKGLLDERIREIFDEAALLFAASAALVAAATLFAARRITGPVLSLRDAADRLRGGDLDARARIFTNDEVGFLARSFNDMADAVQRRDAELSRLNRSYGRFVPFEFLRFLSRKDITEVRLGDQRQLSMAVLFADIRSFSSLSERMTPKETFDFLNEFLRHVAPPIRSHGGFIDKYLGDGFMALFPNGADDAVTAGLDLLRSLDAFNAARVSGERVRIGIGIHCGKLTLGILGEEERMESTVISDCVNLAARLEGLTRDFGAPLLVSEDIVKELSTRTRVATRFLGLASVKGRRGGVRIFAVDGEVPPAGGEEGSSDERIHITCPDKAGQRQG